MEISDVAIRCSAHDAAHEAWPGAKTELFGLPGADFCAEKNIQWTNKHVKAFTNVLTVVFRDTAVWIAVHMFQPKS